MLDVGEQFYGWRIATGLEVTSLYTNAFVAESSRLISGTGNNGYYKYQTAQIHQLSSASDLQFKANLDAMGVTYQYNSNEPALLLGVFLHSNGEVGRFRSQRADDEGNESASLYEHRYGAGTDKLDNTLLNTFLVMESVQVPEPSTLAIFALGMIGLASRRFKKQS
ncbi:MAG: hypothetical protein ACI9YH_003667 [Colwellia sp.]|jgi:hypothetical protein